MKLDQEATLELMRKIAAVDMTNPAYEDVGRANDAIRMAIDNVPLRDLKNAMAALPDMAWEESLKKGRDFHESVVSYLKSHGQLSHLGEDALLAPVDPLENSTAAPVSDTEPSPKEPKKKATKKKTEVVEKETTSPAVDASEELTRLPDNGPMVDSAFSAFRDSVFTRLDDMTDHVQALSASVLENTTTNGEVQQRLSALEQKVTDIDRTLKAGLRDVEKNLLATLRKLYTEFRECIADPDRPYAPPAKIFGDK